MRAEAIEEVLAGRTSWWNGSEARGRSCLGTQHSMRPLCPSPLLNGAVSKAHTKFTTRTLALPQATSMPGEILRPTIHSPAIRVYVSPELPDVGVSVHGIVD